MRHTTAHYLLESLVDAGVEYLFSNLGTDHVPLIEECARWKLAGREPPAFVLCPHENVAVHMAGAYAAITGRGQAVVVHVDVGSANTAMGLHNLRRARVPVLVLAGRAPFTSRGELPGSRDNHVHFIQEPFDMVSLVRPFVKWEYNLPSGAAVREVVRRACSVMNSDPKAPAVLTLPRETLMEEWSSSALHEFPAGPFGPVRLAGVDAGRLEFIAQRLLAAEHPIVITSYLGRDPDAPALLDELAQACGALVYESSPAFLNMPRDSVCFGGFAPEAALGEADLGLLLDVDVPWLPKFAKQRPGQQWIQVDVDAAKGDLPLWGFPADLRLQADCRTVLEGLLAIVRAQQTAASRERVATRLTRFARMQEQRLRAAQLAAADPGEPGALSAQFVCARLARHIGADDIVVNEAIRNASAVLGQIPRTKAQTYLAAAGGGLGFSGGTALGAKLARPAVRVVQLVGDGSFHFSNPTAVYAVSQQYALPILTVVFDNGGWRAVKEAVLRVYPDGVAAASGDFSAKLYGGPRHFEQVAQAFGACGEQVEHPDQVDAAIARAFAALDAGRSAVLDVKLSPL